MQYRAKPDPPPRPRPTALVPARALRRRSRHACHRRRSRRHRSRRYLGGFYTYVNMQKIAGRIAQKRAETTLAPEADAAAAEEPAEKAPEAAAARAKTAQAINNPMLAGESRGGREVVNGMVWYMGGGWAFACGRGERAERGGGAAESEEGVGRVGVGGGRGTLAVARRRH